MEIELIWIIENNDNYEPIMNYLNRAVIKVTNEQATWGNK